MWLFLCIKIDTYLEFSLVFSVWKAISGGKMSLWPENWRNQSCPCFSESGRRRVRSYCVHVNSCLQCSVPLTLHSQPPPKFTTEKGLEQSHLKERAHVLELELKNFNIQGQQHQVHFHLSNSQSLLYYRCNKDGKQQSVPNRQDVAVVLSKQMLELT